MIKRFVRPTSVTKNLYPTFGIMSGKLSNSVLYLMSISAGLFVANLYYSQPLLNLIARSFHASESAVSNIPLFTQLGYAAGILFIVPLGDMMANMKILSIDIAVLIVSLFIAAISNSLWLLIGSSFLIGATSSIPQLFVPMAAELSDDQNRGRAIGVVMAGLLIGIIGSRVISGLIGEKFGWRAIYYVAMGLMILLAVLLYFKLPRMHPKFKGSYGGLMKSLWTLMKSQPELRLAAARGALSFAGLSAMWTTLVFLLKDSFGYGSGIAGIFGLLGITGALGSSVVGKLNDSVSKEKMILVAILLLLFSWIVFLFSTNFLIGLIIGVIMVDLGQQTLHITNQDIILSKATGARNRINTVYIVSFFIGGAFGTLFGALFYQHYAWKGVSIFGLILSLLIVVVHYTFRKKR